MNKLPPSARCHGHPRRGLAALLLTHLCPSRCRCGSAPLPGPLWAPSVSPLTFFLPLGHAPGLLRGSRPANCKSRCACSRLASTARGSPRAPGYSRAADQPPPLSPGRAPGTEWWSWAPLEQPRPEQPPGQTATTRPPPAPPLRPRWRRRCGAAGREVGYGATCRRRRLQRCPQRTPALAGAAAALKSGRSNPQPGRIRPFPSSNRWVSVLRGALVCAPVCARFPAGAISWTTLPT